MVFHEVAVDDVLVGNTLRPGPFRPSHPALQGVRPGTLRLLDLATNALPDACANVWLVCVEGPHDAKGMSLQHNDLANELSCRNANGRMTPISRGKSCRGLRLESYGAARKSSQQVRMRAERDLPFKLSPTRKPVC